MLGGFSISMDGRSIAISRSKSARYVQLLMLLLVNPQGLSRSNVISDLFDRLEVADAGNSLNNLIHEARAKLRKAGIPVKSYIENRRNTLRISDELRAITYVDVEEFERLCQEAEAAVHACARERARALYLKALPLYKGEFLPDFMTDLWVIGINMRLREEYLRLIRWLSDDFESHGEPEMAARIRRGASKYFNEQELYTRSKLYKTPAEELNFDDILREIREPDKIFADCKQEAYRMLSAEVSYQNFLGICVYSAQTMRRTGQSSMVMLLQFYDERERTEARTDYLRVINASIRECDRFTEIAPGAYLLLLNHTDESGCHAVYHRIRRKLRAELAAVRKPVQSWLSIQYSYEPIIKLQNAQSGCTCIQTALQSSDQ